MKSKLTIGTRGSRLALIQTELVCRQIRQLHPDLEIETVHIRTAGDKNQQAPLMRLGTSVFVKEIEETLLKKRIDMAIHSLKDVPTEIPAGLKLLAVIEREDPRDVLVAKTALSQLPLKASIGTDSLRRSIQLTLRRPDLNVVSLRGNIETRVRKVQTGEIDGAVIAAAALKRLGWEDRITEYLPFESFLPAIGQGAIVIEAREADPEIAKLIEPLNHTETWRNVLAERALLRGLGGGCRAPIAALGTIQDGVLNLVGLVGSLKQQKILRASEKGNPEMAESIGAALARKLYDLGATEYIAEAENL